jgi:L-fuculose-phosphate aldolase
MPRTGVDAGNDHSSELARIAKWLHDAGFAPGTAGNVSVRSGPDRVLVTPTGCSKGTMTAKDMVEVDLCGRKLRGTREASSELSMHMAVYNARSDVHAVVHGHPPVATAFACCGLALDQPICAEIVMTLGTVPLAPYATTGTDSVGESLAQYVVQHDAILLANHGAVCFGRDLEDAMLKMETLEHFAQISLNVRMIGNAIPLNQVQLSELQHAKRRYQQRTRPLCTEPLPA